MVLSASSHDPASTKELHIAPMLHVSTTEFRAFIRILTRRAVVWTEMVVDETLNHAPRDANGMVSESILSHNPIHPVICQIGCGTRTDWAAVAVQLVQEAGYTYGIDLNLDCPSNRVQSRNFGAILMKDADAVCEIVESMKLAAGPETKISVKCRIGVDEFHSYEWIAEFIRKVSTVCRRFHLHARCVWLRGLSPAQNRHVPPLHYGTIYQICNDFPDCEFWINGGISTLQQAHDLAYGVEDTHPPPTNLGDPCTECNLPNGSCKAPPPFPAPSNLRGCLLGRVAIDNPAIFWDIDRFWYGAERNPVSTRRQVMDQFCAILEDLYPSRCCDNDDIWTTGIPSPKVIRWGTCCPICCDDPSVTFSQQEIDERSNQPVKIKQGVLDRCVKPVLNLFFGVHGARPFRRTVDDFRNNKQLRNCGPAFVLRRALSEGVTDELLDLPLVPTEEYVFND